MQGEPGSMEWAVATIATSLAVGTPTRVVPAGELEDAACAIVGALRGRPGSCASRGLVQA